MSNETVYTEDRWDEFIHAMDSGEIVNINEHIFYYFLEVLPPVYMYSNATLPNGTVVKATYGFAEGRENITAFWGEKQPDGTTAYKCCRTNEMNPYA